MKPLHQTLLVIAVAAGAGAAGYLFNHSMSASADRTAQPGSYISSAAGAKIFALELTDIAGEKQSLEQWRGKIMVVNFWATWCPPCRKEIPDFSRVSRRFENRGVQFVGVSIDTPENVAPFQKEYGVPYPLLIGSTGSLHFAGEIGNAAMGLPFTVILDAEGHIRHVKLGILKESELEEKLTGLLPS